MSIIELARFRKVLQEKPKQQTYYCTKCNQDSFRLLQDGRVFCLSCDAQITNLLVVNSKGTA